MIQCRKSLTKIFLFQVSASGDTERNVRTNGVYADNIVPDNTITVVFLTKIKYLHRKRNSKLQI